MEWPDRDGREAFEIAGFIESYARLPGSPQLSIVSKGDKPDFVVREVTSGKAFGIELTAVYIDDRSVPDVHMVNGDPPEELIEIPYDRKQLYKYQLRLISAIQDKIKKARHGYDFTHPLILAIYVNEYIGIYIDEAELDALVARHKSLFDSMTPFSEVVFWSLPNGGVLRVRPG